MQDPAPGSAGWVWCGPVGPAPVTCCSTPPPRTSPMSLQTAPRHHQQAKRFCTIHHSSKSAHGNIQVKDRKAIAAEQSAKGGEVAPPTEEHLRNFQVGKLPNAPRMKTSSDSQWPLILRDCFKDSRKYAQLTN